jgi:hypothetical protein
MILGAIATIKLLAHMSILKGLNANNDSQLQIFKASQIIKIYVDFNGIFMAYLQTVSSYK